MASFWPQRPAREHCASDRFRPAPNIRIFILTATLSRATTGQG
ncbi:hypothetical protein [Azospirillum argentinense]